MCGIAGIIYRDGPHPIGHDMSLMLQSMKHRGPDSTGYALYREPAQDTTIRLTLAGSNAPRDYDFADRLVHRRVEVEQRVKNLGAQIHDVTASSDYALRLTLSYDGDVKLLADTVESVQGVEDLGDAETVAADYKLDDFVGSHAIGHVRMATESDVDISGAHPYWAYPFSDVAVVHNGQLTNYHYWRRRLERSGHRFQSECDSEIIAVYLAERMAAGEKLEDAMRASMDELDGVFTYMCVTEDSLGMAKDELAAKPLVLYESDNIIAMASEEIAISSVIDGELNTYDPFEGEVMVWTR